MVYKELIIRVIAFLVGMLLLLYISQYVAIMFFIVIGMVLYYDSGDEMDIVFLHLGVLLLALEVLVVK